jgi:hypothetical protein
MLSERSQAEEDSVIRLHGVLGQAKLTYGNKRVVTCVGLSWKGGTGHNRLLALCYI